MTIRWSHQADRGWGTDDVSTIDTDSLLVGTQYTNTSIQKTYLWNGTNWESLTLSAVTSITSDYTAQPGDETIFVDCTGGDVTVTLPDAAGIAGKPYWIKRIDSSANTLTVEGTGGDTIDDSASQTIEQYDTMKVQSDGTEWWIV